MRHGGGDDTYTPERSHSSSPRKDRNPNSLAEVPIPWPKSVAEGDDRPCLDVGPRGRTPAGPSTRRDVPPALKYVLSGTLRHPHLTVPEVSE